jgi:hypothetical protein
MSHTRTGVTHSIVAHGDHDAVCTRVEHPLDHPCLVRRHTDDRAGSSGRHNVIQLYQSQSGPTWRLRTRTSPEDKDETDDEVILVGDITVFGIDQHPVDTWDTSHSLAQRSTR